ncbi:hypothetical protein A3C91_02235 [Candidatus Azambacteria bacterium RIFCSPHIGHO2_02_FULL_52_12]|uniref:Glycosyltransferase RgtA/B/C/D-like domain-containing protein n=1 Tax=Candidatus Azambacteria bacterium RIFCSPLOWO2_01_FULL_46_25 TaxID=1797298 RepID=A0A1F5BVK8_9BACT|nr:MAG: hypothetical protein A3C91_02235 [Candidatus Azambacteria bacterium RIFCSPHIGHO2_02_FULL_52_12]OGD34643.1 MAG: hypothetical protein A2988_04035 [Candidatus Azambacteria bacterium RIFCSPLOWO2_01_FULL_46_25]OGD36512.1 MAG: hypothetical protein A2850_03050 [Candidatus Azambacteria bacterium RIFCSPHIGHO2_01_FULL_51_74]
MINALKDKNAWIAVFLILAVWASVLVILQPRVTSDTLTYDQAMEVLKTGVAPDGFIPNRILTTYLGMQTILLLAAGDGDMRAAWVVMNSVFFFLTCFFFYKIILELYGKRNVAVAGMFLLATNYALIRNASDYVMDVGGWAFYIMALYFSLRYMKTDDFRYGLYAAVAVGIGAFFKEYAFLGFIALACVIIYQRRDAIGRAIKEIMLAGIVSFAPILLFYVAIYFQYHYSYLSWFAYAHESSKSYYGSYALKIAEYVKTFGSLYTFGWFLFLGGLYFLVRQKNALLEKSSMMYLVFVGISALPVFAWPFITQRLSFPIIPFVIIISCLVFVKYEKKLLYFAPLLIVYAVTNYAMDDYVLRFVNIDSFLKLVL